MTTALLRTLLDLMRAGQMYVLTLMLFWSLEWCLIWDIRTELALLTPQTVAWTLDEMETLYETFHKHFFVPEKPDSRLS